MTPKEAGDTRMTKSLPMHHWLVDADQIEQRRKMPNGGKMVQR
jgi:hypothetical protein